MKKFFCSAGRMAGKVLLFAFDAVVFTAVVAATIVLVAAFVVVAVAALPAIVGIELSNALHGWIYSQPDGEPVHRPAALWA
jgi:hypothetical protein